LYVYEKQYDGASRGANDMQYLQKSL